MWVERDSDIIFSLGALNYFLNKLFSLHWL